MALHPTRGRASARRGCAKTCRSVFTMDDYDLLEFAPDATLVADGNGRIVFANSHTASLFGYDRTELTGLPVDWLLPERNREQHVVHRTRYTAAPVPRPMGANLDLWARRRDGTEFPVDVSISPLGADEHGRTICTIRDVSERKRAADALRDSEVRYRSLVQGATYGMYQTTVAGRLLYVNPALVRMLGYDNEREMLALNARELYVDPDERARLIEQYRTVQLVHGVETRWKRRDGTGVTVRLSGRVLGDAKGRAVGYEIIVEDVTERRLLEERLRMAEKLEAVGRLTAGVAHHFSNLLATVVGRIDLVRSAVAHDADAAADLSAALEALRRATVLITEMQDFGQQTEAAPAPLNLNDVLNELALLLTRELGDRVALVFALADPLPPILMDRSHLEGIIISLAMNAREAMPGGGTLTLSTEYVADTASVRLTARDAGAGMNEATRARVFDPFFTTRDTRTGHGLGLSVVYGLVSRSGGSIRAESQVGEGTAFIMTWPALVS